MITEYRNDKTALLSALEQADMNLHANVAAYAVVETLDPLMPFELRWVHRRAEESDHMRLLNERLFNHAFLDYGYKEIRDADNLEGVIYAPIEELFSDPNVIGVAPFEFFDDELARVRMAHGAEEDDPDDPETRDSARFAHFLRLVRERAFDGEPQKVLTADELGDVCGMLFTYTTGTGPGSSCVAAFQRTQRMWIQQKSGFLFFEGAQGTPQAFADRSLRLGTTFDFLIYNGNVFFRNLKALEILFKFNRLVAQRAKDYADIFDDIVADFEKLDERIEASRGVANRLLKMQREGCPVADMDPEEVERRINSIAYYNRKLIFNEDGKIMLTTNREVSDFMRLLNDDYLVSPLTSEEYEARSKKMLNVDDDIDF